MYISYESIQDSLKFNVVGFTLIMTGVYAIADITPIERVKIMKENDKKKKKWERYEWRNNYKNKNFDSEPRVGVRKILDISKI